MGRLRHRLNHPTPPHSCRVESVEFVLFRVGVRTILLNRYSLRTWSRHLELGCTEKFVAALPCLVSVDIVGAVELVLSTAPFLLLGDRSVVSGMHVRQMLSFHRNHSAVLVDRFPQT